MRIDGLRVAIYPNDHRPAHVHVLGPGQEAIFVLECPSGPVRLRGAFGYPAHALRAVEAALNRALKTLCEAWEVIHGAD